MSHSDRVLAICFGIGASRVATTLKLIRKRKVTVGKISGRHPGYTEGSYIFSSFLVMGKKKDLQKVAIL